MQNYFDTIDLPLYAADFDYFRIAREKWELMLARLGQLGIRTITVTTPWGFHEFAKGTIDLTGATRPRRDVAGLLELCASFKFRCLLKIGPYANNCGLLNDGLPHWLANTSNLGDTELLAATTGWFQALSKALLNQQWPDGPVVALQVEDEPSQRQQPSFSKQLTEVRWPIWLRKRYIEVEALNTAYGTSYSTVSEVPFPQDMPQKATPLAQDAQEFLAEVQAEKRAGFDQVLVETGWYVPVFSAVEVAESPLPAIQSHDASDPANTPEPETTPIIVNLQNAIQVDPDPSDVGLGSVWAKGAPIRNDGSVRRSFWRMRLLLWQQLIPDFSLDADMFSASFETGGLVTGGHDTQLKLSLTKGTKPTVFQLQLNGALLPSDQIKAARGRLSGFYQTEDDTEQADMVIFLRRPAEELSGFLLSHLQLLLAAQAETLSRCATLTAALGQRLSSSPGEPKIDPSESSHSTPYTLAEARRGLSEADRVLRKAMESIGGLEAGFDIMLGRSGTDVPEPATPPPAIRPDIFEGRTREILTEAGHVCEKHVPQLLVAAEDLQGTISQLQGFTVEQYQQAYVEAITVAQNVRQALLEIVAQLRVEMISEQLPLVAWRVHNQILEVTESLRWGVLRR